MFFCDEFEVEVNLLIYDVTLDIFCDGFLEIVWKVGNERFLSCVVV